MKDAEPTDLMCMDKMPACCTDVTKSQSQLAGATAKSAVIISVIVSKASITQAVIDSLFLISRTMFLN
jgi:hypothetical protein